MKTKKALLDQIAALTADIRTDADDINTTIVAYKTHLSRDQLNHFRLILDSIRSETYCFNIAVVRYCNKHFNSVD